MGERLRSTEGAKLSGACNKAKPYTDTSLESLNMSAEGARVTPYLSGKRTELNNIQ